jgi:DNA-binding transcriptional ArsR family regulator
MENIFSVLSDQTRRSIFEVIAKNGQMSAGDIASKFLVSVPAVSQHLKVLRDAELVHVEKVGKQRFYEINPTKLGEIDRWTEKMVGLWTKRLDRLDEVIQQEMKHRS